MAHAAETFDYEDDDLYDEDGNYRIKLTEPQSEFWYLNAKYPLFCAGYGAGKTLTMTLVACSDLLQYPGSRIGIYAPVYDLLSLNNIPAFEEHFSLAEIPYKLNKSRNTIDVEVETEWGQKKTGTLIFRSLDNPGRIVGYQVFRSHIDEIDVLPADKAKRAWNKVIARNRQKIYVRNSKGERIKNQKTGKFLAYLNKVSAYTTPEGFGFVYERWVENKSRMYAMVRASSRSNPHLPDDYIESLYETYDQQLADAYVEGKFVNLVGKNVYRGFDRDLNSSLELADQYDELHVGMDFNVVKGAAVIHVIRNGRPHAVDEIHDAYDTDEQIKILKERYPKNIINIYPDATGDHRTSSNTVQSDIQKLRDAGFNVYNDSINPAIKDRVNSFNALICNGKGERKYFVNRYKCPNLVKSLEQQIWGSNGLPDKKEGLDHIVDAAGYYVNYCFGIVRPKVETFGTRN